MTRRAVTLVPLTRPTSGEVLVPMVIEIAGSSTWISGSATGFSGVGEGLADGDVGDAGDRDDVAGAGGLAGLALEALGDQQLGDLDVLDRCRRACIQATVWPFFRVPSWTRTSARRPRNGEASRLVTWACSGAPSVYVGAGIVSRIVLNSGSRSGESGSVAVRRAAPATRVPALARGVDDREVQRVLAVRLVEQVHEQLVGLVDDLGDPGVAAVGLVDHQDDGHVGVERLAQHEAGLRERALGGVDEQHDAVDHGQAALDLATEVGVAGGVDDVDRHRLAVGGRAGVVDRGVLREDRDALLALEVAGVHHPLGDALGLVGGERAGLAEHRVDQRGLAVVDVGDDRDVAEVDAGGGRGHAEAVCFRSGGLASASAPSYRRGRPATETAAGLAVVHR